MTEKKRVTIFDDEEDMRREWQEELQGIPALTEKFDICIVGNDEFGASLEVLRARREAARKGVELPDASTLFDKTAILIVDYDLLGLEGKILGVTGEEVAYLARCYSTCGLIVALNQYARESFMFDMTLRGHPDSFADLNLLDIQISNPGLWSTPWEGFRPWYWPILPQAAENLEQCMAEVEPGLDCRVLDFFEFPDEVREIIPLEAANFIKSPEATIREFVYGSGKVLRGQKELLASDSAVARVAAARLSKWLERLLLPGQNVLVDAAHLIERYPSLFLVASPEHLIDWTDTHLLLRPGEEVMRVGAISDWRFKRGVWLSRGVWYWPKVNACEEIPEVKSPWDSRAELAFCEDTSRFMPSDEAVEFVAKVESPFVRRYVSTRDPKYGPQSQFAL